MECRKFQEMKHNEGLLCNNKEEGIWGWGGAAGNVRLKRRTELINDFIASHASSIINQKTRILELGCGIGLYTQALSCRLDSQIISLDIYEGFVHKASNKVREIKKDILFLVADAEALPFLDESFDLIVGVSVLHHLNLSFAIKEIYRILKPQGRFIFSEPNMLNPQIFMQKNIKFIKRFSGDSPSETAFYSFRLKDNFAKYNFDVEVEPFDFLHPKTPKAFIPFVKKCGLWLEQQIFLKNLAGSLLIQGKKHE